MYRNVTGDALSSLAKLTGSALFFGPLGLKIAAADVAVQAITGSSVEQHILSLFDSDSAQGDAAPSVEQQIADSAPEKNAPQTVSKTLPQDTQESFALSRTDATVEGHMSVAQQGHQRVGRSLYASLSHPISTARKNDTSWTAGLPDTRFGTQAPHSTQPERPPKASTPISETPPRKHTDKMATRQSLIPMSQQKHWKNSWNAMQFPRHEPSAPKSISLHHRRSLEHKMLFTMNTTSPCISRPSNKRQPATKKPHTATRRGRDIACR